MTETLKLRGPAFLAIGSELLDGRVHESNALYAARALADFGITFSRIALCDDVEAEILDTLDLLARDASIIIVSGGLGPTTDDLTREALARYCGVGTFEDADSLAEIQALFERRKRQFNPINRKQATFPVGATIIRNPIGTAPGFQIEKSAAGGTTVLVSLPGVPREFIAMFDRSVMPLMRERLCGPTPPPKAIIRTFGLSESEVGGRVEALKLDPSLIISYRAHFPEIQTKILHTDNQKLVSDSMARIEATIGEEFIFARSFDDNFEDIVVRALKEKGLTVALAESCTGGGIGNMITNPAGSSAVFLGSAVVYSNHAKTALLGVPEEVISTHGAVSQPVAEHMASGARKTFNSDIAVSVTGIAGPDGGSEQKPVGTYCVGVATKEKTESFKLFMLSSRINFKKYVACVALDIARRHALGLSLELYRNPKGI